MSSPRRPRNSRSSKLRHVLLQKMLLLLLFGLLASTSRAQQFTFRHYGQNEGLRNLDVFKIVQDKEGLLWIATENGLFRYDGSEFHRFTAADGIEESLVLSLALDSSGRIWTTTNDHLYYFDGTRFQSVPTGSHPMQFAAVQRLATLGSRHVLFLDRGTLMQVQQNASQLWTAAPYFTPQQTATHPELSQLHSIMATSAGTLWLGCGHRICRVKDGQLTILGSQQDLPDESWTYLYLDRHGWLWARSPQHIRVLAPDATRFAARDIAPNGLSIYSGAGLLTFTEDAHGDLLTQTDTGIARWNGTGWRTFDRSNGLAFDAISTILSDQQGSIWISTRGHGIYRWLGYDQVENWTTDQGLRSDIVWPILRDRESRVWIADQLQLSQLDNIAHQITVPPALAATALPHATGLTQTPDGALWILHIAGDLLRYDPSRQRITFRTKIPTSARLFQDSAHRIWFLTREGLYVVREPGPHPTVEKLTDPLISTDAFADAAEDASHNLWFLADNHLYRLADGRFEEISIDRRYTRGQMRNIAVASDGTLWIGGGLSALLHLRVQGAQASILNTVSTPDLVSTDVQIVRFDHRGWLWIGTDLGVNVFDGSRWRLLTEQDGLISNDTDEGAFFADHDGSIWIGVNGGAIHLLHPEQLFSPAPLTVQLKSATLGDRAFHLTGSRNVWRWRDVPLDITFTSLNFDRDGSLLFRYRLLGLESEWTQTPGRHLHYAAMPPGDYRFEVQAVDPAHQKQSQTASFAFTIRPPWWRTTYFYFFLAVLFTSLSVLVWYWRERALIRRQQILRKLVAQRTLELEAEKAELLATREELRRQATRDALTGIWNRSAILDVLERELDRTRREGSHLAVVLADIDHFKRINDTHGHLAGDSVLRDAAQRMLESVRPYDFVGRYGGEEFLMVLPGLHPQDPCPRLTELQQTISDRPFQYLDKSLQVTSSFGVVWMDSPSTTVEDMIRCADQALYEAKAAGRDRIIYYTHPTTNDVPTR
ncbi:diguanylate cyclase (GGDEF)-like protein [Edaphobacter aggregans]|uniref:diguanylate cyclase n=1 Tax=Edaphobacter aggregans TaxID=570835 RepID=A0A3R9Q8A7_9BACT|nr:diguanylate cyclase [Edaphobacter aggregans]RSL15691.1 diguanylate cyclase (GGDEF)-like protein [Edaphobacter aggregans]